MFKQIFAKCIYKIPKIIQNIEDFKIFDLNENVSYVG